MKTALALVLLVAGCGHAHLGDDHGKATYAVLDAQTKSKADAPAPQTASDTTRVLSRHRGEQARDNRGSNRGSMPFAPSTASGAPAAAGDNGTTGTGYNTSPIRLEAK